MKKIIRWAIIYLLLIIGLFFILFGHNWYLIKQKQVGLGLARPGFPYIKYTQEELDKMYPQYPNENVPTRQTPEETYAKFIAALKEEDLEEASKQFMEKKQKEWLESLEKIKEEGLLEKMISDLDKKLEKVSMYDTLAQYEIGIVIEEKSLGNRIDFIKDTNGDWKIDSL